MGKSILERFMNLVNSDWQWMGHRIKKSGYGQIEINRKMKLAHRVSYELFNGPIPEGAFILHSCDDPGCVNPEHLHVGDQSMNIKEMLSRGRGKVPTPAKITEMQVKEIRELCKSGLSQLEVSKRFGISRTAVEAIMTGRNWKHVQ